MKRSPGHPPVEDAQTLRSILRTDLVTAMKSRRPEAVSALRTALAAMDNAEAVAVPNGEAEAASAHFAGTRTGVGSTEAERRVLSIAEAHALLTDQIQERVVEADRYEALGERSAAHRLRLEADALRKYTDE